MEDLGCLGFGCLMFLFSVGVWMLLGGFLYLGLHLPMTPAFTISFIVALVGYLYIMWETVKSTYTDS